MDGAKKVLVIAVVAFAVIALTTRVGALKTAAGLA